MEQLTKEEKKKARIVFLVSFGIPEVLFLLLGGLKSEGTFIFVTIFSLIIAIIITFFYAVAHQFRKVGSIIDYNYKKIKQKK